MNRIIVHLILLSCFIAGSSAGEFCVKSSGFLDIDTNYCEYGCCSTENDGCCRIYFTTGIIIAIAVGSVLGLCTLIGIIACICCSKSGNRRGRVIQPMTHVVYTNPGPQTHGMQPGYAYPPPQQTVPQQPPPYGYNTPNPQPGNNPNLPNPQPGNIPNLPNPQTGYNPNPPNSQPGNIPNPPNPQPGNIPNPPNPQPGNNPNLPNPQPGYNPETSTSKQP